MAEAWGSASPCLVLQGAAGGWGMTQETSPTSLQQLGAAVAPRGPQASSGGGAVWSIPPRHGSGCVSTEQGSSEPLHLAGLEVERLLDTSRLEEGRMVIPKALAQEGLSQPLTTRVLRSYLKAKLFCLLFAVDGVCAGGLRSAPTWKENTSAVTERRPSLA